MRGNFDGQITIPQGQMRQQLLYYQGSARGKSLQEAHQRQAQGKTPKISKAVRGFKAIWSLRVIWTLVALSGILTIVYINGQINLQIAQTKCLQQQVNTLKPIFSNK